MNLDKGTCWYDYKGHEEMILGATGKLWPVLEKSMHWGVLKELIDTIPRQRKKRKMLDIGCGAGCLGQTKLVKDKFCYTGVDLPEVITNVATKVNPDGTYLLYDLVEGNGLSFMNRYDVIVMNAFIDVMQSPMEVLYNIIDKCKDYVIIHRQFITTGPTKVKQSPSYRSYTYISYINELEFNNAIKHFKIVKKLDTGLGKNNYSYLLKRFKTK